MSRAVRGSQWGRRAASVDVSSFAIAHASASVIVLWPNELQLILDKLHALLTPRTVDAAARILRVQQADSVGKRIVPVVQRCDGRAMPRCVSSTASREQVATRETDLSTLATIATALSHPGLGCACDGSGELGCAGCQSIAEQAADLLIDWCSSSGSCSDLLQPPLLQLLLLASQAGHPPQRIQANRYDCYQTTPPRALSCGTQPILCTWPARQMLSLVFR